MPIKPAAKAWLTYAELTALYFVQGAALGMWFVPLTSILDAAGLQLIKPFAFATSGIAAFISPLFFGAMADRHVAPVIVMRWLAVATAAAMTLAAFAIQHGANPWLVLGAIQLHQLFSSAAWSMTATVIFLGLRDATREFGPVRAVGTLGWMAGCWIISALSFDASPRAGYVGATGWLLGAGMTFLMPVKPPPASAGALTLRERFGFDALALLKNRDHRVIFITTTLAAIPVAAFYPYTPPHLRELGFSRASSWMSLGQTTELVAMISLAAMMTRWRIKWVVLGGLVLTVARFAFCALGTPAGVLTGVILHGASYTCVSITAQIYLNERVDPAWRARAQALLSLMTSGVGNLAGYLACGWWFAANNQPAGVRWPVFWSGLAIAAAVVLVYFLIAYHGRGKPPRALQAEGAR